MSRIGSRHHPRAREAGRVVLVDAADRVLLLKGTEPGRPGQAWWITPGGGLTPGESHRDGAARETAEETGWVVKLGFQPCLERVTEFPFDGYWYRQHELFYPARLPAQGRANSTAWTEIEHRTLMGSRWWTLVELRTTAEVVYPGELADVVENMLLAGWR